MDPSFLLAFPLLLALSTSCNACGCKLPHPQTIYCTSDFVIRVNIMGSGVKQGNTRSYNVNVTKVFKGPWKKDQISKIYTPSSYDKCGYSGTSVNQTNLLIAGYLKLGQLHFTRCHVVYQWARLFIHQRLGLKLFYRKGCGCHIQQCVLCRYDCPEPDKNECTWKQEGCRYNYWNGDHTMTHMCFPGKSGQCKWTPIPTEGTTITPR